MKRIVLQFLLANKNGSKLFDTTGAQISWLKQDLARNTQKWTIVYWHHPPYTKGSHNSDTEYELIQIRDKVIRLLDQYKVDLVLCGHSHNYERSKIMKGHYGTESTFNPIIHNFSSSSALYNGSSNSCPYIKSSSSLQNEGIVYVVAGSAGKLGGTSSGYPHDAMYYSNSQQGGSLYLEITGNRLDGKWIAEDGSVPDQFTIMKDVQINTIFNTYVGDSIQLTASWEGLYHWSPPAPSAKSITVSPLVSSLYVVDDSFYNCLQDSFYIQVLATISGYVHTRDGNPVKGVAMILSGDRNDTTITDEAGFYTFSAEAGGNYLVTALATDSTAGNSEISTVDILHIRRHILHTDTLSPHQIIAADVNESKDVSTADIAWIRSVILDNLPGFPSGKQWEFIQSDEVFGDPLHPFPFSSTRTYSLLNGHHTDQNFIGIRLGDVYNPGEPSGP